jgi:hypothetical protein
LLIFDLGIMACGGFEVSLSLLGVVIKAGSRSGPYGSARFFQGGAGTPQSKTLARRTTWLRYKTSGKPAWLVTNKSWNPLLSQSAQAESAQRRRFSGVLGVKTAVDLGWAGLVVSAPVRFGVQGLKAVGVVVVVVD